MISSLFQHPKKLFFSLLFLTIFALPATAFAAAPRISNYDPRVVGKDSKGIVLTITGNDFPDDIWVDFGGTRIEPDSKSSTEIKLTIPDDKTTTLGIITVVLNSGSTGIINPPLGVKIEDTSLISWKNYFKAVRYANPAIGVATYAGSYLFSSGSNLPADMLRESIQTVAYYAELLLTYVLGQITNNEQWSITRACVSSTPADQLPNCSSGYQTYAGAAFMQTWEVVRKWANMLIVVGMIAIALATIIRWPADWEAKKLLPTLLLVAVLINFSVVFVGLIIDVSNIIMKNMLLSASSTGSLRMVEMVQQSWNTFKLSSMNVPQYFSISVVFSILYFLIAVVMIWFSVIFIERYVWLAILFIFSPIVFVAYIFPKTRSFFNSWRDKLIKWSFIGLGAAFMMRLSIDVLNAFSNYTDHSGLASGGGPGSFINLIFKLLIVALFMLTSLKMIAKSDGLAKVVMAGITAAVAAFITGGTSLLGTAAGGAAKMAGNSKIGSPIKDKFNDLRNSSRDRIARMREYVGLDKQGSAEQKRQEVRNKQLSSYDSVVKAAKDEDVAYRAVNANSSAERAAYAKELASRKKTHLIKEHITKDSQMQDLLINAHDYRVDTSEYIKADFRNAPRNLENVRKEKINLVGKDSTQKDAQGNFIKFTENDITDTNSALYQEMHDKAELKVKASAAKKMSAEHIEKFKTDDLADLELIVDNIGPKRLKEGMKNMGYDELKQYEKLSAKLLAEQNVLQQEGIKIQNLAQPTQAQKDRYDEIVAQIMKKQGLIDTINSSLK